MVLNKHHLLSIGGHDESYYGHGAEDFELLHRITEEYPISERPIDYSVNTGSGPISSYRGFRAYFALYGEPAVNSETILVHLYHPKRKGWGYYKHRRNFSKLKHLMEKS
jgi:predicted glycosyltransferase involved in capsule biosynthesis